MNSTEDFLKRHRGVVRRSVWLAEGLSLYALYALNKQGDVCQINPGVYAAPDAMTRPEDIVQLLSLKHPRLVMSLLSALQFHGLTTQIPQELFLSVPRGSRIPRVSFCQLNVKQSLPELMKIGAEVHHGEWGAFKVFNPERCLIDLFKYRHEFGQDVFLEVLHEYRKEGGIRPALLMEYADKLRVLKNITPYLEAVI